MCMKAYLEKNDITLISGSKNLVAASPHTISGETSVCAPRIGAERASSVGICFTQLTLNLGQQPLSQKMVSLSGPGFA